MNIFFTSDNHFGHEAQIAYSKRPFLSLAEMDSTLIKNWNNRIKHDDLVYVIGDFVFAQSSEAPNAPKNAFDYYSNLLNGKKIFLLGSHDKNNKVKSIIKSLVVRYGGHSIWMTHDPKDANSNYKINLVGHVHQKWQIQKLTNHSTMINIGVDVWNFTPVTINEILSRYSKWRTSNEETL